MGLVTAIFRGRPGLISGGAGAVVVVVIALMKSKGIEYVFAAVALAGVVQIVIGLFKLGKFIRLVPGVCRRKRRAHHHHRRPERSRERRGLHPHGYLGVDG